MCPCWTRFVPGAERRLDSLRWQQQRFLEVQKTYKNIDVWGFRKNPWLCPRLDVFQALSVSARGVRVRCLFALGIKILGYGSQKGKWSFFVPHHIKVRQLLAMTRNFGTGCKKWGTESWAVFRHGLSGKSLPFTHEKHSRSDAFTSDWLKAAMMGCRTWIAKCKSLSL